MKPKIQLVGGCAASFENNAVPQSGNDSSQSVASSCGETIALIDELLATILKAVNASAGVVRILSADGKEFRSIGRAGLPAETHPGENIVDADYGVCKKTANTRAVESSDAEFCRSRYGADFFAETCNFLIALPLGINKKEGEPSGVLTLFFAAEKSVTDEIRRLLQSYAELIYIAVKSHLHSETSHQSDLLAERQSIANEIHDSLAQTLYYSKIRASLLLEALKTDNDILAFKCAQDVDEALEGSQKTVRELVTHFRCQMDPKGLRYALEKLVKDFIARTNITLEYVNQLEEINLPLEYELQIFLIVRESLVNVATHSGAVNARLSVTCKDGQYQFTVEDNGGGVGSSAPLEGHYGLEIMRERALRIGGVVEVESLGGLGTRVQLIFSAPAA